MKGTFFEYIFWKSPKWETFALHLFLKAFYQANYINIKIT